MASTPRWSHLLVGLDESGRADPAVRMGLQLRERFSSHLDLLHAVSHSHLGTDLGVPGFGSVGEDELAEVRRHVLERLAAFLPAGSFEDALHVVPGRPAPALLRFAEEHDVDLILLGAHEKRTLFDFGNTARAVLAKAPCPVWVQHAAPPESIRRVLAPVDTSDAYSDVLSVARELARAFGAAVHALHVFEPPQLGGATGGPYPAVAPTYVIDQVREAARRRFERCAAEFDWAGVPHDAEFADGMPDEAILERAADADLVVMGTHGHTGLAAAVLGSVAYSVLRRAEKGVVAVRQAGRRWLH